MKRITLMRRRRHADHQHVESGSDERNRGVSLIEVLVSVVLLGMGATSILGALASATNNSTRHRAMANAEAWVQSAGDYLASSVTRIPCYVPGAQVIIPATYEAALRSNTRNSDDWSPTQLRVIPPVQYWNGARFGPNPNASPAENAQDFCLEIEAAPALWAQLVTLEVTSPDGRVTRTLTVVKGS